MHIRDGPLPVIHFLRMKKTDSQKIDVLVDGFNRLDAKVTRLDLTVDKVVHELVDMKEYMHTELATKQELHDLHQDMLTNFDAQGVILERLDHEFVAMKENTDRRLRRVEGTLGISDHV